MEKTTLTHHDLNLFTGDLERFRHWLCRRVIYTPGVHYLAERGQAHWLLDAIAFYFGSNDMVRAIERDKRLKDSPGLARASLISRKHQLSSHVG